MVFAAYRDDTYNLVLLLHILAVIIGFAPAFVNPFLSARFTKGEEGRQSYFRAAAQNSRLVYVPAIIVAGLLGIVLIPLSEDVIEFSDLWVSLSFLVWIAIIGIMQALIVRNERAVGEGDDAAEARIGPAGGFTTLLLIVMLYLMIFQPT